MIAALHGLRNSAASGNERDRSRVRGFLAASRFPVRERGGNGRAESSRRAASTPKQVDSLISDRTAARARKDFKESDRIRDELAAMGVVIKDSKEGTTWEIAR